MFIANQADKVILVWLTLEGTFGTICHPAASQFSIA